MKPIKNLSMIVAASTNGVIGVNNKLPWHIPEDLKRFRALTMGHHIIMGRKTFESIGKPLPGRMNVVVTRNESYQAEGVLVANSVEKALELCGEDPEIFLIGGSQLYQEGYPLVSKLYYTEVLMEAEGDAHLPNINFEQWRLEDCNPCMSENGTIYSNYIYHKSKKIAY